MVQSPARSSAASPEFVYPIVAADTEIDELGHVSNVAYVRWIQEAARAHSDAVGWRFDEYRRLGAVFVIRRIDIEYLRPSYAGDPLLLTTWIESWRGASSVRCTRIAPATPHPVGVPDRARASVQWVLVDLATGRPRRIPREVSDAFWTVPLPR